MHQCAVVQLLAQRKLAQIKINHLGFVGLVKNSAGISVHAVKVAEFVALKLGEVEDAKAGVAVYAGVPFGAKEAGGLGIEFLVKPLDHGREFGRVIPQTLFHPKISIFPHRRHGGRDRAIGAVKGALVAQLINQRGWQGTRPWFRRTKEHLCLVVILRRWGQGEQAVEHLAPIGGHRALLQLGRDGQLMGDG